jgi:hypothetical protein
VRSLPRDEISHWVNQVRPLEDYEVDRPEVEARRRVELTGTNRPRAWLLLALAIGSRALLEGRTLDFVGSATIRDTVSVAIAEGKHPVPSRTRK